MSAFISDQLDQMSKKELLEFARTAHETNVKLVNLTKELRIRLAEATSRNVKLEWQLRKEQENE